MVVPKKIMEEFLDREMDDKEMIKLKTVQEPNQGSQLRIDLQVPLQECRTLPPRNIWGIQTNSNAKSKNLNQNNRVGHGSKGKTKSFNVEAQIEVTEDANEYLHPALLRHAFRMSIIDRELGQAVSGVHKVTIDEEFVISKDKHEADIEILRAVARVIPNEAWATKNPGQVDKVMALNPPAKLPRETPRILSKARAARAAVAAAAGKKK